MAFSTSSEQTPQDALDRLARNPTFPGLDGVLNDNGEIADGMGDKLRDARDWLQAALEARTMARQGAERLHADDLLQPGRLLEARR